MAGVQNAYTHQLKSIGQLQKATAARVQVVAFSMGASTASSDRGCTSR
jgi:hypothetical protein